MAEAHALLLVASQTSIANIINVFLNEINHLGRSFVLVLDDYHQIENQAIHELISALLLHPPANLHLVLSTRMDPPLPLVSLRANSQLSEIRVQDLRFHHQESLLLFQQMINPAVDPAVVSEAEADAEGWVTGLRLAALAMRHRIGRGVVEGKLTLHNRYVTEYLLSEILAQQAERMSDCLLRTSILERFCADLCAAVCVPADGAANGFDRRTVPGLAAGL